MQPITCGCEPARDSGGSVTIHAGRGDAIASRLAPTGWCLPRIKKGPHPAKETAPEIDEFKWRVPRNVTRYAFSKTLARKGFGLMKSLLPLWRSSRR